MSRKGYPVPGTLPDSTGCLIVFYPKDDEAFFSQALAGQLTQLNSYWVWDADDDYAHEIGYLWAKHNLRTMLAWDSLDCELASIVENGEDMNVNVSLQSGGCGCCCGGSGSGNSLQDWLNLANEEGYQPFPDEPMMGEEEELANLCDAATQWADWVLETMGKLHLFFAGVTPAVSSVVSLLKSVIKFWSFRALLLPAVIVNALVAGIAALLAAEAAENAAAAAAVKRSDFICAIVNSTSPANAKANCLGVVAAIREEYGLLVSVLFWALVQITDWRKVTIENSELILPAYVGSDCSDCDETLQPQEFSPGYWLVPVTALDVSVSTTATWEYLGGNSWSVAVDPAENWIVTNLDISEHGFDWDFEAGTHRFGYQLEFIGQAGGFLQMDDGGQAIHSGRYSPATTGNGVWRGAIDDLDTWASAENLLGYPLAGNAPLGTGRHEIKVNNLFSSGSELTMTVRIWVVVDSEAMV